MKQPKNYQIKGFKLHLSGSNYISLDSFGCNKLQLIVFCIKTIFIETSLFAKLVDLLVKIQNSLGLKRNILSLKLI